MYERVLSEYDIMTIGETLGYPPRDNATEVLEHR